MLSVVMLKVIILRANMLKVIMLKVIMLSVVMLNIVMLNVIILSVVMLNVVMLNVIMLSVVILSVLEPKIRLKQLLVYAHFSPVANVIKLFFVRDYGFPCLARVLFSLDWKSLPMTNTLAYYKNP